jgi:parallel beta-helix repeat protein
VPRLLTVPENRTAHRSNVAGFQITNEPISGPSRDNSPIIKKIHPTNFMKNLLQQISTVPLLLMLPVLAGLTLSAGARDIWVQAGYTGTSDGSTTRPYKHINDVTNVVIANNGDVVRVRPGTYSGAYVWMRSGVVYKSETPRGAKLVGVSGASTGIFHYWGGAEPSDNGASSWWSQRSPLSWTTIDGFDISYPLNSTGDAHGIAVQWAHHITIKNNWIHDVPSAGIQTIFSDYITIEDNRVSKCAWWPQALSFSGISMWKNIPLDDAGGGYPNNFHNYIRRNYLRQNYQSGGSDGNGIIIDTQRYDLGTLIENNVCYSNGGAGIALAGAWNCTVRFNTLFRNCWEVPVPDIYATQVTWETGAWNASCNNLNLYGNLIDARLNRLAIAVNPSSTNWNCHSNLRWHESGGIPSGVPNIFGFPAGTGDTTSWTDVVNWPQFVSPGYDDNANFRLQWYAGARDRLSYGPSDGMDMAKLPRSAPFDLGAFEYR